MDSLKITRQKQIAINDDPNRIIKFDPSDVLFVERFYNLYREFSKKEAEFKEKAKEIDERKNELDENGAPIMMVDAINFAKEVCLFMHDQIDKVFGEGTSEKTFEGSLSFDTIGQFLEGIAVYVSKERNKRTAKYIGHKKGSNSMK